MSRTVTREDVRAMLRKMLPGVVLRFEDERADEVRFTAIVDDLFSDELLEDEDDPKTASLSALDRLDRAAERRGS